MLGFSIENEVACIWSDSESVIGKFQDVVSILTSHTDILWISNVQGAFAQTSHSKEIDAFVRLMKQSYVLFKDKCSIDLDIVFSLYSYQHLTQPQLNAVYQHFTRAIQVSAKFLNIEDSISILSKNGDDPIMADLGAITQKQIQHTLRPNKTIPQTEKMVRDQTIALLSKSALTLLNDIHPLQVAVCNEYSIEPFEQYSLDELYQFCSFIEVNCSNWPTLLKEIYSGSDQNTIFMTVAAVEILVNLSLIDITDCLNVLIFEESEKFDISTIYTDDLAELAVSNHITALLILNNLILYKTDNLSSQLSYQLSLIQIMWAHNIQLMQTAKNNNFICNFISLNSVNIGLVKSQLKAYMKFCCTELYEINTTTFHAYKALENQQHG